MASNGVQNNLKSIFSFWRTLFVDFFGQVWENSGKNPFHPQTFACSYTCGLHSNKT